MKKTINLLREFSVPLIAGVIIGLVWANISPETYHHINEKPLIGKINLHFFVNDVFMVFFFAIASVEITHSFLPGGNLNPFKKAINPMLATVGGVIGPACVYILMNHFIGSPEYSNGWGIPTATDIALAWLLARFIFGEKHPAVSFLLLLAIADDAIGLLIIAVFYPDLNNPVAPVWLLLVLAGITIAFMLRKLEIKSYWPYLVAGGILSWTGLFMANLHPALALVVIVPFMPAPNKIDSGLFEDDLSDHSTITDFEHEWKIVVDFGLLLFGVSNAGVEFSAISTPTWLVFFSLLLGKTFGVFLFGMLASFAGFKLPERMGKKDLFVAGCVAGLGLTVALFVAGQAFTGEIQGAAKMGALFSAGIGLIAFVLGKVMNIEKINE